MDEEKIENPVNENYVEIIKNLKANTVSKEEYDRVVKENKTLADAFAYSAPDSTEPAEVIPTEEDIQVLRNNLTKRNQTNFEFIKNACKLRESLLARGERDPFLPKNEDYQINTLDEEKCQNIYEGLKYCIDESNNDPELFNANLKRLCK